MANTPNMIDSQGNIVNPASMVGLLNSIGVVVQSDAPASIRLSQLSDLTSKIPPGLSPDASTLLKLVNAKANQQLDAATNPDAANGNGTGQGAAVNGVPQPYSSSADNSTPANTNRQSSITSAISDASTSLQQTASDIGNGISAAETAIANFFN